MGTVGTPAGSRHTAAGRRVMKTRQDGRLKPRFAPEARFEVNISSEGRRRRELAARLEDLRVRLLRRQVMHASSMEQIPAIQRAAEDAAARAWYSPCPLLLFPLLFEELTESARATAQRQERIRQQSRELLARAA